MYKKIEKMSTFRNQTHIPKLPMSKSQKAKHRKKKNRIFSHQLETKHKAQVYIIPESKGKGMYVW